jgi:hypothetical protein
MTAAEVTMGHYYAAKVSGNMTIVKIEAGSSHGGWEGRNIFTNRRVRIKSAAKLRGDVTERGRRVERDMKELGI